MALVLIAQDFVGGRDLFELFSCLPARPVRVKLHRHLVVRLLYLFVTCVLADAKRGIVICIGLGEEPDLRQNSHRLLFQEGT